VGGGREGGEDALAYAATADHATAAYADEAAVLLATARGASEAVVAATGRIRCTPEASPQRELGMFSWPVHLISAHIELGRLDEAEAELAVIVRRARPGAQRTEAARMRVAGQLAAARHDIGLARRCFTQALAVPDEDVDVLERALTLEAFGRFLRRRGERRSAIERLRDARDRYRVLGAAPFLERCERELAACGVHDPGARALDDPLTPQERAVAALICAGKSNRQAAQELVLSVKTIGYHLANVYAKLDVHSRAQLVEAMRHRRS
jgi:ATP/maltotriose-dependent transcriptional regulator MalT